MSVGIIRYPGSNCDYDTLRYFSDSFFIWHKETEYPENMKLLVIPGGFAFGDRLYDNATSSYIISPGTMALKSPVSNIIKEAAKRKIPILGICNGFQILTQMGLLPGTLIINNNKKFTCKNVACTIHYKDDKFNTRFYIANSYGKYEILASDYNEMQQNNQIFITYDDDIAEVGSTYNIAGVCNKEHNIYGMMPHPERNNSEFKNILDDILFPKCSFTQTQVKFDTKISELMNSEHISYKSTRKYLKKLHTKEPWVIQGPGENAGIVDIGDGYCIALRIESHNHPTFINPFEGAATGVGGILRDIFTMGARPIAILDFLRFGNDDNSKRLLEKSVDGISYYGNCIGVPNVGGDCYIGDTYDKNPLINIGCIGVVKKENIIYGRATAPGQLLIYVGSKTGNEGIGGAAMASNSFDSTKNIDDLQDNVQKADPFLEKLLLDACCEIAENKLAVGMQDMGAGGILCASQEVLKRGKEHTGINLGCRLSIDKVPTKCNMDPCNILISESQERMYIVATEENKEEIFNIFKKWDLEYSVIGITTDDGIYSIYDNNQLLYTEKMSNYKDIHEHWERDYDKIKDYHKVIKPVKKSNLWKQYDSTVGNRTIKGPDASGHYSLLDIYEINKILVITWSECAHQCLEKMKQLNAKPLCLVNCLNFGHPEHCMASFSTTIDNINEVSKSNNVPVVGGNVSLYNSTDGESIRPTPIILMMGII